MHNIPEEAVKAAIAAYDKYYGDLAIYPSEEPTPEGAFHAAFKAALPFLSVQWDVKKLEWKDTGGGYEDRNSYAQTRIGRYEAFEIRLRKETVYGWSRGSGDEKADSFEAAKAAAQADYEARILSALEPSAARDHALEEAARVADYGNTAWLKKRDATVNKKEARDYETMAIACSHVAAAIRSISSPDHANVGKVEGDGSFQGRVKPWMLACFGEEISNDKLERCDRFIEEALELVQAIGYSPDRAHALVDYVFNREIGEPHQEVGGVMVTLAALCLASGLDMAQAGEDELARIWTKVEKIRAKQAAKPTGSALPIPSAPASPGASE